MTLGRDLFTLALICVWFNPLAFSLSISRITVVVSLRILFPPSQWSDDHCKGRRSLAVNMSPERCQHPVGMGVNMSPEWVSTSGRNGVNFSSEYAQ
jgi:hypothetical protein